MQQSIAVHEDEKWQIVDPGKLGKSSLSFGHSGIKFDKKKKQIYILFRSNSFQFNFTAYYFKAWL
jgi:hypothetical protein